MKMMRSRSSREKMSNDRSPRLDCSITTGTRLAMLMTGPRSFGCSGGHSEAAAIVVGGQAGGDRQMDQLCGVTHLVQDREMRAAARHCLDLEGDGGIEAGTAR